MGVLLFAADAETPSSVPVWVWIGVVLVIGAVVWAFTTQRGFIPSGNCQECSHAVGLDDQKKHCGGADETGGWGSERCTCKNDYHWNYDSTSSPSQ
jgi:hypothetical protein